MLGDVARVPFGAGQASGYDELAGAQPFLTNALVDEANVIQQRPGIREWAAGPTSFPSTDPVTLMTVFQGRLIYVTQPDNKIWAWGGAGYPVVELSALGADALLDGTARPNAVVNGNICVIVAGGKPQKVTPGLISARLAGSPPLATDVAILARRIILAQKDSGLLFWSGVLDPGLEVWDTSVEFREAEANADNLVALRAASRYLVAWGTDSTEVFAPDPVEAFTPTSAVEEGLLAPHSVVRHKGKFFWLSAAREIVMGTGHEPEPAVVSGPIARELGDVLSTVSDCWGFRARVGQHDCLVWSFPTDGRTFCLNLATKTWGEWFGWSGGRLVPFAPTAHLHWPAHNVHLVGMPDGTIRELTLAAQTDLGAAIKWRARSGFIRRGELTDPHRLHVTCRRGEAASAESRVEVSWRDDLGPFCSPLTFTLGQGGTFDPTVTVEPVGGTYEQRQYEIGSTAADACAVTRVEEVFAPGEVG